MNRALIEFLIVGVLGLAVGAMANGIRSTGSLKWTRNYFARVDVKESLTDQPSTESGAEAPSDDYRLEHDFQEVSLEEARQRFDQARTGEGTTVFVDARKPSDFEEGHVPGAIPFDHYYPDGYIEPVLAAIDAADAIVVYCNGGECEDSVLVCGDLIELGIPYHSIYLFAAGWEAWTNADHPIEVGEGGD